LRRIRAEDWDYPANFDYIHTRVTLGCWQDMKTQIMERAFGHLRPGGWLECQEVLSDPSCDDGTLTDDHDWLRWARDASFASEIIGRQLRLGDDLKHWMREAGFVNITETVLKLPASNPSIATRFSLPLFIIKTGLSEQSPLEMTMQT